MKPKQNILITGSSSGIGRDTALAYAAEGVHLILTGRNETELQKTASECAAKGASTACYLFDMRNESRVLELLEEWERKSPPDIIIANAGIMRSTETRDSVEKLSDIQDLCDINFTSCIKFVNECARILMKRNKGGQIAIIASLSAVQPINRAPTYSATKAGLVAYGEALGNIAHKQGITVSVICPGFVGTPMTENLSIWQPTQLTSESAARSIKRAITNRKRYAAFPLSLYLAALSGRFLPSSLQRLSSRLFE